MNRLIIEEDDKFDVLGVVQYIDEKSHQEAVFSIKIVNAVDLAFEVLKKSLAAQIVENHVTHLFVGSPISQDLRISHNLNGSPSLKADAKLLLSSYLESKENILNEFSSITVLNDLRSRIIDQEQLTRTRIWHERNGVGWGPAMKNNCPMKCGPTSCHSHFFYNFKTYPDVDEFYLYLLRSKFKRLVNCGLKSETRFFHCFKMFSKELIYFDQEDFINYGRISDSETSYIEYCGSRVTYSHVSKKRKLFATNRGFQVI